MFGKDEAIRDPAALPEFHLDYRERLSEDPAVRWTDRLTYDGTWVCNLFQFYQRVSNARLGEVSTEHPADLTKTLQGLAAKGFLEQVGQKRGTFYRLPAAHREAGTPPITAEDSTHNGADPTHNRPETPPESDPKLLLLASPAWDKRRLPAAQMREIIFRLCEGRFLTPRQIGSLLHRSATKLQERYLRPMAQSGELILRFPEEPNHPEQAYTAKR